MARLEPFDIFNPFAVLVAVKIKSMDDLLRFNEDHREKEMPYFGQVDYVGAAIKALTTDIIRLYNDYYLTHLPLTDIDATLSPPL